MTGATADPRVTADWEATYPPGREIWVSDDGRNVLWNAAIGCDHTVVSGHGGGIRCSKCGGWFCY